MLFPSSLAGTNTDINGHDCLLQSGAGDKKRSVFKVLNSFMLRRSNSAKMIALNTIAPHTNQLDAIHLLSGRPDIAQDLTCDPG
jgi:hypothetical protein